MVHQAHTLKCSSLVLSHGVMPAYVYVFHAALQFLAICLDPGLQAQELLGGPAMHAAVCCGQAAWHPLHPSLDWPFIVAMCAGPCR
jgi:hypothetical protein